MQQESDNMNYAAEAARAAGFTGKVNGEQITFGPGFAGMVQGAQDVSMMQAGAVAVAAGKDMTLSYGGSLLTAVGGDMDITNGGAQVMTVGGNLSLTNGGGQVMIAGGNLDLTNGGGLVLAGQQVTATKGFFGILLARNANLEGSRVLLDTRQAAIFGAVFGAVFALLSALFRRR